MAETDPQNLLDSLTARIGAGPARDAVNVIADWARSQAAVAEHAPSNQPWADKHNASVYRQVARVMTRYGAAPPADDLSLLAAAVWCALADAGHTAAIDSQSGDGYQVSYTPGAVLVTLVRGTGLTGTPWAAVQRQMLQPWADTLTAAGYAPESIGDPDAPKALRVPAPAVQDTPASGTNRNDPEHARTSPDAAGQRRMEANGDV